MDEMRPLSFISLAEPPGAWAAVRQRVTRRRRRRRVAFAAVPVIVALTAAATVVSLRQDAPAQLADGRELEVGARVVLRGVPEQWRVTSSGARDNGGNGEPAHSSATLGIDTGDGHDLHLLVVEMGDLSLYDGSGTGPLQPGATEAQVRGHRASRYAQDVSLPGSTVRSVTYNWREDADLSIVVRGSTQLQPEDGGDPDRAAREAIRRLVVRKDAEERRRPEAAVIDETVPARDINAKRGPQPRTQTVPVVARVHLPGGQKWRMVAFEPTSDHAPLTNCLSFVAPAPGTMACRGPEQAEDQILMTVDGGEQGQDLLWGWVPKGTAVLRVRIGRSRFETSVFTSPNAPEHNYVAAIAPGAVVASETADLELEAIAADGRILDTEVLGDPQQ